MRQILVTGGAGFIGSNFIRYLMQAQPGIRVVNLDKLTYAGNKDNLRDLERNPRYRFIKGDICLRYAVKQAIKGCDAVINFAAESHVDRSIHDPMPFVRTDIQGTLNLLEEARTHKVERFIQISTDEVYGSVEKGSSRETDALKPRNPYSASKAGADLLALSYFTTYGLPVLVTRSSNNFGPYQFPEKIVPLFLTNLLRGRKVPLYGDGKNVRDWLYVLDNCTAIERVLLDGKPGEVYNVGGGNEVKNIDLARRLLKGLGLDEERIEWVKDRPGHDRRYSLDSSKIKKLGWKPAHKFGDALKATMDWYKAHNAWWEPLVHKGRNA
ncbi:MAG: dTDP-glucose 4,6-dehydratase [Candidatus Diapherotrites archaeon]|uniref:dTDP-glucose 4,6-dehydratase n=1 Tax=Candidatus Iainarchaeum sp. TaxID=3101447 RepID=A0A8T4LC79_9ARCH|nr:dTDP-glucose 4,6-dehydratase [Candidatus Diapherotrites archaeon]